MTCRRGKEDLERAVRFGLLFGTGPDGLHPPFSTEFSRKVSVVSTPGPTGKSPADLWMTLKHAEDGMKLLPPGMGDLSFKEEKP